jgi:hypothetical protein
LRELLAMRVLHDQNVRAALKQGWGCLASAYSTQWNTIDLRQPDNPRIGRTPELPGTRPRRGHRNPPPQPHATQTVTQHGFCQR